MEERTLGWLQDASAEQQAAAAPAESTDISQADLPPLAVTIDVHMAGTLMASRARTAGGDDWDEQNPAHVLAWYIVSRNTELLVAAVNAWKVERGALAQTNTTEAANG
jgi:hypothetical protein